MVVQAGGFRAFAMATGTNPGGWLTARRLRAHGTILAVCLWSLYVWNLATPGLRDRNENLKGTDFLHLYTLGSLAAAHRGADLYDMRAQASLAAAARAGSCGHPLFASVSPAGVDPVRAAGASLVWLGATSGGGVAARLSTRICCYSVWRACPNLREHGGTVVLLAAAFPAFFHLIAWGQTSAVALACFTLMFFLLRDRREFLAGLVLGCLIFKPQLGLAAAIVFLAIGAWKIVVGAALSATAQLCAGVLYYGAEPLRQWMRMLRNVRGSVAHAGAQAVSNALLANVLVHARALGDLSALALML